MIQPNSTNASSHDQIYSNENDGISELTHTCSIFPEKNPLELSTTPKQNYNELPELIIDDRQTWQVHNCKLLKLQCSNQGTLPFIYHYDRLADFLKHEFPLTGTLLAKFDEPMTAKQACELIGVPADSIDKPKFVKITGSIVVFLEPLQLAIRMHWSNTSKKEDTIYCQSNSEAIKIAMDSWQFIGRVDTLFKQGVPPLAVYDEQATSIEEGLYLIPHSQGYHPMPHNFAVSMLEKLQANRDTLTWIDEAIKVRVE